MIAGEQVKISGSKIKNFKFQVQLFVLQIFLQIVLGQNYCNSNLCPRGVSHIGCGHSGNFSSSCPADRSMVVLSNNEIEQIIDIHNTLRNKIASGNENRFSSAAKMSLLSWNVELSELAALNVKQCFMNHDQCRNTAQFLYVGQNLGYRANTAGYEGISDFINNVVNAWYNEVKDASASDVGKCCGSASQIGHFLQMIQDQASFIGCAISRYSNGRWKVLLLACNYSYANILSQSVYVPGTSASACGSKGKNSRYPALCN